MNNLVKLLSAPANYAVVQLPDRRYPGVVFQGDSLHILSKRMTKLRTILDNVADEDTMVELTDICDVLSSVVQLYENVCRQHNIELPYVSDKKK